MAETTRKEFEKELEKQDYSLDNLDEGHTAFQRKIGNYTLMGMVHENCDCGAIGNKKWTTNCYLRGFAEEDIKVIENKFGTTYDIAEFNKTIQIIAKELHETVIPNMIKLLQLPKELSDKLD